MKTLALITALTIAWMGFPPSPAFAEGTKIQNDLGETLYELHMAKPDPGPWGYSWGPNLLSQPIPKGAASTVDLPKAADSCVYDFLVTGNDGAEWEVYGVDLCRYRTITFRHAQSGNVVCQGK